LNIFIKNVHFDDIFLEDFGLNISSDSIIDLSDFASIFDIYDSPELKAHVYNNKIKIVTDGTICNIIDSINNLTLLSKQDYICATCQYYDSHI
jgi:hypothetical protein